VSWLSPIVTLAAGTRTRRLQGTAGTVLQAGLRGVGLPPVEVDAVPVPDGYGSAPLGVRLGERNVFIPVVLLGADTVAVRNERRSVEAMLSPVTGPVGVTVQQPDTAEQWTVYGHYVGGMEGAYGRSESGVDWQVFGLEFRCLDPLFYGPQQVETWFLTAATKPLLSESEDFFPVQLGDSLVAGRRTLRNIGDEPAWPVVTAYGPGSDLVVENVTTGLQVSVSGVLTAGQWVQVDGPAMDVFDHTGSDAWDRVPLGEGPFPLAPGDNVLDVSLTDATEESWVRVSWRPARRSGH
jgi:hypothetical protein